MADGGQTGGLAGRGTEGGALAGWVSGLTCSPGIIAFQGAVEGRILNLDERGVVAEIPSLVVSTG